MNGASDLLVDIFGEKGKHARVTVGVSELPENVPVEIELTFEIKSAERECEADKDMISDHILKRVEQKKKSKNRNRGPYRKAAVA